ncbi:MAG: hypothetical protein ACK2UK_12545 [Candidatus Promineifilaceae bacterium]
MSFDPETLYTLLAGILLSTWFCASLVHQFRFKWWNRLASFDRLHLLPRWTFFAPNPGRQDLHLLYRTWEDGQPEAWQELGTSAGDGGRWRWLWNPDRYPTKAISDLVQGLLVNASSCPQDAPHLVIFSGYYLSLLALVMEQRPACPGSERQFAIVATQGFGGERPLDLKFLSERHRVEP